MGIAETIDPTSDQLDAVDLLSGPRTFTITRVTVKESADQPVDVYLAEFPRVWRPGKSMRRVLVAVWGTDETAYVGRRVTLFCNPKVRFGGAEVGGTRISHMSHIDKKQSIPLIVSKGQSATYYVEPLRESAPAPAATTGNEPTTAQVTECTDVEVLGRMWQSSGAERRIEIEARVAELKAAEYDPTLEPGFGQEAGV